jgi:ABC-type multidrug transport system ATPase subunit
MTSHLMDEVEFLCDRIAIISQGQMKCIGDLNSLK